jgi:hypothetical protein
VMRCCDEVINCNARGVCCGVLYCDVQCELLNDVYFFIVCVCVCA